MVAASAEAKRAKTARVRRALIKRDPKLIENPRTALIVRGQKTSGLINSVLTDLYMLKKPFGLHFKKHNAVHPFEDIMPLEFLCQKNDASIFAFGTHSKKRPQVGGCSDDPRCHPPASSERVHTCCPGRLQNLCLGRMHDHHLLDMAELGVEQFRPMADFPGIAGGSAAESKPCLLFEGAEWESVPELKVPSCVP